MSNPGIVISPAGNRGAALITVMFVFAIAAIIAMAMASRLQVDILRTRDMHDHAQAYEYALAGEELARQVLAGDESSVTYNGQGWANMQDGFTVEHGALSVSIEDLQGRFNLNDLLGDTVAPAAYFQQLLVRQGVQAEQVPAVIAHIAGMAVNGYVDNATALRSAENIAPRDYEAVVPDLTAIPDSASLLNVNTASDNLLAIYMPDKIIYKRLMKIRSQNGFISEQQLRAIGMNTQAMTVKSSYFLVKITARFNAAVINLASVLYRDPAANGENEFHVVSRDLSRAY